MTASFYAVATSKNRVRVIFSEPMAQNAFLDASIQYVVSDMGGAPVNILTVSAEQASSVRSTVLGLGTDLVVGRLYRIRLLNGIVSEAEQQPVSPDTAVFQWTEKALRAEIPVAHFSGKVVGGLYGSHNGLVFFSPALQSPASNSIIQVDQVDVCTRAYDEYHIPESSVGLRSLMTHGSTVVPTPVLTTLNSTDVLWAFPRVETRFELGLPRDEAMPHPVDGPATATLAQTWPSNRIALLNNTRWKLFKAGTPETFITADTLTPFPPSPPVIIPL